MSGSGNFGGTTYQARVIAYVYAHILAQAPLGWIELFDDTPLGVSGETSGPGDDARLEFGERHPPVEVQAKHGLTAGAKLSDAVAKVRARSAGDTSTDVIFVVDRGSSRTVHREFARDLERYRTGRTDGLRQEIKRIAQELGPDANILERLYVATADLDSPADPDAKAVLQLLDSVLDDRSQASAAWSVLADDADDLCTKKLRRTRKELVNLLTAKKIAVRLPTKDERFMRQLDLSKQLLAEEKPTAVLSILGILESDLKGQDVGVAIRYRAAQHRAAALLQLGRSGEALNAARMALDFNPTGTHAMQIAAHAAAESGDIDLARRFADRALAVDASDADVWAMRAQISALAETPLEDPSAAIAESESYQFALAQIAANAGDWSRVEDITGALLARGLRRPRMLYLRVVALANLGERDVSADGVERRANAIRLAGEAIDSLPEDVPLRAKFLVLRAEIHLQNGDVVANEADIARAMEINDTDPDAIAHKALAQLHAGRADYALATLRIRAVEDYPMLLVIRAQAFAENGDSDAARRDLDAAIARVDDAAQPDAVRLFAAEAALAIHDGALAERYLDALSTPAFAGEMPSTIRGRAAFERRDADALLLHFRAAAATNPAIKPRLYAELGQRLFRLERMKEAVAVFEEVGLEELPAQAYRDFAGALMETNDLPRAAKLVEAMGNPTHAPEWAVAIAADIAARQGDLNRSVMLLKILAERRLDDTHVLHELTRRLLAMNDVTAARAYLDRLTPHIPMLKPRAQMAIAQLLKDAGRFDAAVPIAFSAFRASQQDPALHRGLVMLLMTADTIPTSFTGAVADQTYVRLQSDEDSEREYVIYADGPVDPLRNELSLHDATTAGLTGKREGETFVMQAETWRKTRWTVKEILPAIVYVFRDVVAHFEDRFPAEPFFIHMMKMSDEKSVKFLSNLISPLHARKERVLTILKLYRENLLPLGFFAGTLDVSIAEIMQGISGVAELGPLHIEWSDIEGQKESRRVALEATRVVLTRSALETCADLGILDVIVSAYDWRVPQSLVDVMSREVTDAEEKLREGQRTIGADETGYRLDEISAGAPVLKARVDRARMLADWIVTHAHVEYRPLDTIEQPGSRDEELRATLGGESLDAVQLAEHFGIAMLADDLGLRRMLPNGSRGRSFSTIMLIGALVDTGKLVAADAERLLLILVRRNYATVLPTRALLLAAIQTECALTTDLRRVFALLGGPILDLSIAARIAAETLKAALLLPLRFIEVAPLTDVILEALAVRWPVALCVQTFRKAAAAEFALLPNEMRVVRETATRFLNRPR